MRRRQKLTLPQPPPPVTAEQLQAKWNAEALALPKETRQKFLDLMWQGKTVGEAQRECGIEELMVASALVCLNVEERRFLRRESA
jgi:hypothetical protein